MKSLKVWEWCWNYSGSFAGLFEESECGTGELLIASGSRPRGRQHSAHSTEVWCDYTVSKIAIAFNHLAGCTNQNGEVEGPVGLQSPQVLVSPSTSSAVTSPTVPPADLLWLAGQDCARNIFSAIVAVVMKAHHILLRLLFWHNIWQTTQVGFSWSRHRHNLYLIRPSLWQWENNVNCYLKGNSV